MNSYLLKYTPHAIRDLDKQSSMQLWKESPPVGHDFATVMLPPLRVSLGEINEVETSFTYFAQPLNVNTPIITILVHLMKSNGISNC